MTRVANMLMASIALLIALMGEAGCHSALSSGPARLHHGPITAREILIDSVALIWFVGALGLSSGKRFGWVPSLIAVEASVCCFGAVIAVTVSLYFSPKASDIMPGIVIGALQFSGLFAISVVLFIGLLKMRKDLR
jgi:hypothetical protein